VVATEGDNPRVVLPILGERDQRLAGLRIVPESGERCAMKQALVSLLDLVDGIRVIAETI
jgi:hypothetical protein